jgi:ABC-type cobalamin/Fe3+-siderophores transport system ATPase subunit
MADPVLTVSGLHAGYGTTEILRGVGLTVGSNEIVAVLGANGAGKSTLNRTISGVVRPWRGSIRFGDAAIEREKPPAIVARGLTAAPIAAPARGAPTIATGCSQSSRGSPSAKASAPARSPAASSRCSPSAAG